MDVFTRRISQFYAEPPNTRLPEKLCATALFRQLWGTDACRFHRYSLTQSNLEDKGALYKLSGNSGTS
jgi:hypothetical protein